ncbi:hypothetical protein CISIN_1g040893mg [Citrus sinensis]|uniref:Uncharacterized protein n=1 Tax=Citrus sinensis TaxID=2711 RepID=A0A067EY40_CITSI|nr:hypothetical protein CISIN_1g040893mg [Citrus sinensis]
MSLACTCRQVIGSLGSNNSQKLTSFVRVARKSPLLGDYNQQSVGSTGNGVPLSGLIEFAPQFESQGSRLCWENMCLPVRAGTSSLGCDTSLKVPPTVGALPRIPRG